MPNPDYLELGARRATFLFEVDGLTIGEFVITSALNELIEGDLVTFSRGGL